MNYLAIDVGGTFIKYAVITESSVKIILIEAGPDILIFRCSFQVGCYLGDIGKLNDFFQLLICHEPALHGADLGGESAV